jgi:hypothetical protein
VVPEDLDFLVFTIDETSDHMRYLPRKAGFSFRNLSVHGFGSPVSYQKDFLNIFLQVAVRGR